MAKKRVEENTMGTITLDDSPQEIPMREIPKRTVREEEQPTRVSEKPMNNEPVSCLRNERIIVRFVPKPTAMVHDPKHILYGGMAENATRSFVVPRLSSTGMFKNVLTDSEKEFLERAMGLEYNALSIYKKNNNFWDDSNPMGIGRVILHKQDNYLDLSIPEDYIKYKILLANKDEIASSLRELEDRPKATYQFVIISENAEASAKLSRMDVTMKCYMEYGKVEDDVDTLRVIIELLEGRPLAPKVKLDYLQGKVNEYIQRNPRLFLSTIKDELLPAKVLIKKCVEAGLIGKKNDTYYLRQDNSPMCEINEESTLNNAARFISSVKRQDLKYSLEAKLKE
jgi:hypothetical protein